MVRDSVQLETAVNTISHEYLLEFTSEYDISEMLHPELPGPGDRIVDFPEGKVDVMPANGTYSVEAVRTLDTHRTPIQKQPEMLLCLVGISHRYYLGDEVNGPIQFNTCSQSDKAAATDSSGVPSTIERSSLDFAHEAEASGRETAASEMPPPEEVPITTAPGTDPAVKTVAVEPHAVQEIRKRGHEGIDANAPPKSLRRDHADFRPSGSSRGGKSLAAMQLSMASNVFVSEGVPADVSDPDPLAFADAPSPHPADVAYVYRPEWGVTNGSLLDTSEACQDLVDHAAPSGYFSELRHMHNEDFLGQYNINLAQQVAMGSQLRLRFEQEAKLLRKSVAQVARRDQRIQAQELEIKNLEAFVVGVRGRYEEGCRREECWAESRIRKNACPVLGTSGLQATARPDGGATVIGHGLRLATMKCAESLEMRQAFADVVSAGIAKGMSEGLKHGVEHRHAQRTVGSLEAYDPEAESKFAVAFQSLKDLKLPLLDQLEGLKDAPMDVIMASLYLEDDTGEDAPQFIRDLRPSSSQLAIPVYPEVRDPRNPWACKEGIKLADAIAANISRAEQKKRSRIVCRTHGVGSAHHARSDRVPVSAPIVVPQGLAFLLVDAATQTESDDA
nr:hypothetical protein [Tanacetum cinerariifolium]